MHHGTTNPRGGGGSTSRALLEALRLLERGRAQEVLESSRRIWSRHPTRATCMLMLSTNLDVGSGSVRVVEAQARDVSRGGVGLLCPEAMPVGSLARCVFVDDGVEVFAPQVMVRHTREVVAGAHLLGCVFAVEPSHLMALGVSAHALREGLETDGADSFSPVDGL